MPSTPTAKHTDNSHRPLLPFLALACCPVAGPAVAHAQKPPVTDDLVRTVAALDKALFDAYNGCDLETLGRIVSEDLEFYDDRDGLSVGRQPFLESNRKNICGNVHRELVPSTMEVYRLGASGALEIGVHRFHHPGLDDTEPVGEAKFIIIWQQRDGVWRVTRTLSYGHGASSK